MARRTPAWLVGTMMMSCGGPDPESPPADAPVVIDGSDAYVLLDPVRRAVRTSMVLRGQRPSVEELARIRDDPSSIDDLVDAWLDSDAFGETIKDMHAEWLLVRADLLDPLAALGPMEHRLMREMFGSPSEAPLELARHIVMTDRPYTEVVTADYMLTDEVVAEIYDLPYDPSGPPWQPSHWPDGRVHAGLLSSTELWRRHESAGSNFNRLRADLVADLFLCEGFAGRDVAPTGGVTLSDEFEVAEAVRTDAECVNCHQALDPLAAFFWGFKKQLRRTTVRNAYHHYACDPAPWTDNPLTLVAMQDYCYPLRPYSPEDEEQWADWDLPAPSYYGRPGRDLGDLGAFIADDPRFAQCMARRFYGWMTQSDPHALPRSLATELQRHFVEHGFSAKALVRRIVHLPSFYAVDDRTDPEVPAAGLQIVRPEQLARSVEALTGFRWTVNPDTDRCEGVPANGGHFCWGYVDLMRSDRWGYRSMAGGINGSDVTLPVHWPMPVRELVNEAFAAEASGFVVRHDLLAPTRETPRLLTLVDADTTEAMRVREQITALTTRLFGETHPPDDPRVDALFAMWEAKHAQSGSVAEAWALTLTTMMLDPLGVFF